MIDVISNHDPKVEIPNPIAFNLKPPRDDSRVEQIESSVADLITFAENALTKLLNLPENHKIILCSDKANAFKLADSVLDRAG